MKKYLKNKKILFLVIVIFIFFITLFTFLLSKNNTKKILGNISAVTPANNSFNDISFYECVLYSYNKEFGTNYKANYNLPDEELSKLTNLSCYNQNSSLEYTREYSYNSYINYYEYSYDTSLGEFAITSNQFDLLLYSFPIQDLTGIEKLTGLKKASLLISSTGSNINLGSLTNLENLELYDINSKITGLDSLTNLKELTIVSSNNTSSENNNDDTSLQGISNMTNLESLHLVNTNFTKLSLLSNLTNLKELYIRKSNYVKNNLSDIQLNDLSYINNLTHLMWNGKSDETGDFTNNSNLVYLNLSDCELNDMIDYSIFPNLESLDISNSQSSHSEKSISDLHINSLDKLKYLDVRNNVYNLSGINDNLSLETLLGYNVAFYESNNIVKKFLGSSINPSYLLQLEDFIVDKSLSITTDSAKEVFSKLKKIILNDYYFDFSNIDSFPDLEMFIGGNRSTFPVNSSIPKLKTLVAKSESDFDFENFPNLEVVSLESKGYDKINVSNMNKVSNLKELKLDKFEYEDEVLDLSNNSLLENVYFLGCDNIEKINFSNNSGLLSLIVDSMRNLNDIHFPDDSKLKIFYFEDVDIEYFDLSKQKELVAFMTNDERDSDNFWQFNGEDTYNFGNLKSRILPGLTLPKQYKIKSCESRYNSVACEDGYYTIRGGSEDKVEFVVELDTLPNAYYSTFSKLYVTGSIHNVDLEFKNIEYNKNSGYILPGKYNTEKKIIKDIKGNIPSLTAVVDNNNLNLFYRRKIIGQLEIIKLSSSDYLIDYDEKKIYYTGTFDINKVNSTNSSLDLSDDNLNILYNNELVDTYKIKKLDLLLGDVNEDGEITLTDVSTLYRYIRFSIDFSDTQELLADVNENGEISITDVGKLYMYYRGKNMVGSDDNE